MSNITMEKDIAIDLLNTKLRSLKNKIEKILEKWNQTSSSEFIQKTREGEIPEAELDAISMTNLLDAKKKYEELLIKIES